MQKDGWTVVHDETGAMGPYAYKGNQWVSYDDVAMIRKKSQLIRDMGLGGGNNISICICFASFTCGVYENFQVWCGLSILMTSAIRAVRGLIHF